MVQESQLDGWFQPEVKLYQPRVISSESPAETPEQAEVCQDMQREMPSLAPAAQDDAVVAEPQELQSSESQESEPNEQEVKRSLRMRYHDWRQQKRDQKQAKKLAKIQAKKRDELEQIDREQIGAGPDISPDIASGTASGTAPDTEPNTSFDASPSLSPDVSPSYEPAGASIRASAKASELKRSARRRRVRGLGAMTALVTVGVLMTSDFSPFEVAPALALDASSQDEFRGQMIMPLALGADSGHHMGATHLVQKLNNAPERPEIQKVATMARGDSFRRMLERAGVDRSDATAVGGLISQTVSSSSLAPGTKVDIKLGRRPAPGQARPLLSLSFRARLDLQLMIERTGDNLAINRIPIRVDETPLRIRGLVGSGLYRSARAAGAPASAVQQYLSTLGDHIDIQNGLRATDTFDIIVSHRRAETGERKAGKLLYAGVERNGLAKVQLMRWGQGGKFFEASGVGEERSGLARPVPGAISSKFGMRRHPILGYKRMHSGLDFRAGRGTPIVAVSDATVKGAGRMGGCGNAVRLSHGGGLETRYCHMSRIAVGRGQSVRRGQVIGYVGSTGLSTGPHLHYEMYRSGRAIDPASVRYVTRAQLSGEELQRFRGRLTQLKTVQEGAALANLAPDTSALEGQEPRREIDRLDTSKE